MEGPSALVPDNEGLPCLTRYQHLLQVFQTVLVAALGAAVRSFSAVLVIAVVEWGLAGGIALCTSQGNEGVGRNHGASYIETEDLLGRNRACGNSSDFSVAYQVPVDYWLIWKEYRLSCLHHLIRCWV